MIRIVVFSWASTLLTWALFNQTGEQYSTVEYTRLMADILRVAAEMTECIDETKLIKTYIIIINYVWDKLRV